ncbi:RHS repeat-associated core domain-containing protein [Nocardia yunnanensis]|uniref:RHS repeat-associated core domain-containing protein n=1 Tax=Nocardia yunnanensis TaxID=2382165 RepID=UPI0013C42F47|nr:RHS repeat-associated core domain-containing protein [Nocardia yunnanensis]
MTYDSHGEATQVGGDQLGYDAANRHVSTKTAAGTQISYVYDPANRLVTRSVTGATQQANNTTTHYGYASSSDSADVILDANGAMVQRILTLPGGVTLTVNYGQSTSGGGFTLPGGTTPQHPTTWSYPNLHGDILFTADGSAARSAQIYLYDPYGQDIDPGTGAFADIPISATAQGGMDFGSLGQYERPIEHLAGVQAIEMGARTFLPILGRFLQPDPVPGGSANDYDYVFADPVNHLDLAGTEAVTADDVLDAAALAALGAAAAPVVIGGLAILGGLMILGADSAPAHDKVDGKTAVAGGDFQHVKDRHMEGGKDVTPEAGIFEGTEKQIKDRIAKTIDRNNERKNTPGEDGQTRDTRVFEWDFGEEIGKSGPANGSKALTAIRAVVDKAGKLVTAHPI